jgi:hypothetical protein
VWITAGSRNIGGVRAAATLPSPSRWRTQRQSSPRCRAFRASRCVSGRR